MNTLKKIILESRLKNDPKEYDFEGEMAKNDLQVISMHSQRITEMLEDNTNLPEWVQSKITLSKDYLQTVSDYLASVSDD